MVTAPFAAPSPGTSLLDRLASGASPPLANGADRTRLRPLPHHADLPDVMSAKEQGPAKAAAPSWNPPMQNVPRDTLQGRAIDAPHVTDASFSPVIRDAKQHAAQRGVNEARPAPPMHIAAGSLPVDPSDALRSVIRTSPSFQGMPPSQVAGGTPPQAQGAADSPIWATEALARRRVRSVLDSTGAREPQREDGQAFTTPRPQANPESARAGLRSRDASSVSPLPRPAPLRAEQTIEIHIGRIEVRAQTAANPPAAPAPRAAAPSSNALAAHLGARGRGARS